MQDAICRECKLGDDVQNQNYNVNCMADFFQNSTPFPENATISADYNAIIKPKRGYTTKSGNFPGGVIW